MGIPKAMLNPLSPKQDSVISTGLLESCSREDSSMKYYCGERAANPVVTRGETVKRLSKGFKVREGKNRGM